MALRVRLLDRIDCSLKRLVYCNFTTTGADTAHHVWCAAQGKGHVMATTENLAWAIHEVIAKRDAIISKLKLAPDVFDSWVKPKSVAAGEEPSMQSLYIILAWIRDVPELKRAREQILHACNVPNSESIDGSPANCLPSPAAFEVRSQTSQV